MVYPTLQAFRLLSAITSPEIKGSADKLSVNGISQIPSALDIVAMAEHEQRREHVRKSMSYRARIVADDGTWMYPCEIFDVSVGGARLAIYCPPQAPLPHQFLLQLSEINQTSRYCELAWRQGNEIGVRFVRVPQAASNTADSTAQLSGPN
jgi:hypothetical protein